MELQLSSRSKVIRVVASALQKSSATLAILCGGRSQRFGTDKGLHAPLGDEPLVVRAIRLLQGAFTEILVVVRDEDQARIYEAVLKHHLAYALGAPWRIVQDITEHEADRRIYSQAPCALLGVSTALHHAKNSLIVAVPVDQIGVRPSHLRQLLDEGHDSDRPTSFVGDDGTYLPFPSLWHKSHQARIDARIIACGLSVRGTLAELDAHGIAAKDALAELNLNANTEEESRRYFGKPLFDPFGRRLQYLRFSLTEACNLSCHYCLPDGFPAWYRHKARLGRDATAILTQGFRLLGFRKIRLTGGEPTVHPDCLSVVKVARHVGYETIAMTTNGLLIDDIAPWVDAGLTQLNVSLDSLDPKTFEAVTGSYDSDRVKDLIEQAVAAGLEVKVNTVLMRSRNGSEANIESLIDWALGLPLSLRFIELMDTGLNRSFASTERVYGYEIEPSLRHRGLSKIGRDPSRPHVAGPATEYASSEFAGRIGLINPLSCNFCGDCNRLRVTARGALKLCLFGESDMALDLSSPEAVADCVRRYVLQKPEKHYLEDGRVGNVSTFRTIGG